MTGRQGRPLRIAHVLAGAKQGGAENFYTRLVCELAAEKNLTQCAFTRAHHSREQAFADAQVEMQPFRFGSSLHWLDRKRYRAALNNFNPDIVLSYMNRATHSTPPGNYKLVARLGHYYSVKYYQHCDYWIGITEGICSYLVESGMPAERVFRIPNFVDERQADSVSKNELSTPSGVPVLFALGRLHVNKGFDVLLEALAGINTKTVLWLAGEGPEKDNLQDLASDLGIASEVRFLGWRDDVNALMQAADLFICPSRHEGLGSVVIEAWLNRCPMVATESQGPKELITDKKDGLLTPVDDADSLAAAIQSLIQDPMMAKNLADEGFLKYKRYYSKDHVLDQYWNLFQQIA